MGAGASSLGALDVHDPNSHRPSQTTRTHLLKLARAYNKFALQLISEAAKDGKRSGNQCLLPLHVALGLGALYLGAHAATIEQMYVTFQLDEVEKCHLMAAYAAMHWDAVKSSVSKGCLYEVALGLFAPNECCILPSYKRICQHYELTRLRNMDFRSRPDLARKEINRWAEEQSNGRIKDPIPPLGYIERETRIFMLCAVYVKVQFLHPFEESKTKRGFFHLQLKETLPVNLMEQQNRFRFAQYPKLDCHVLELPCANNYNKLIIFLPNKIDGLRKVEEKLNRVTFDAILDLLTEHTVDVTFPRFKHEAGGLIGDLIQKAGIEAIFFQGKADLSGVDGSRDLCLSRVYHYTCVDVDEGCPTDVPGPSSAEDSPGTSGVNSSASTTTSTKCKVKSFKADHPFMYILWDEKTGAILLGGRVLRPLLA